MFLLFDTLELKHVDRFQHDNNRNHNDFPPITKYDEDKMINYVNLVYRSLKIISIYILMLYHELEAFAILRFKYLANSSLLVINH